MPQHDDPKQMRRNPWAVTPEMIETLDQDCYVDSDGYLILHVHGHECFAHDIIWMLMTGEFPKGQVEHINGINSDNRWCNLRIREELGSQKLTGENDGK